MVVAMLLTISLYGSWLANMLQKRAADLTCGSLSPDPKLFRSSQSIIPFRVVNYLNKFVVPFPAKLHNTHLLFNY